MYVFYLLSLIISLILVTINYEVQAQREEIESEITHLPDVSIPPESSPLLPGIPMSPELSSIDSSLITELTITESEIGDISTNPLPSDNNAMSSVSSSDLTDITEFSDFPAPGIGNNNTSSSDSPKYKTSSSVPAIIIVIIALVVIAGIVAILVCVICRLKKKSSDATVDDSEAKLGDIEAQQAMEPEVLEPIGEEAIKRDEYPSFYPLAKDEPVVSEESQQTDESKQSLKEDTPIETPIQDSQQTPKDETKQIPSQQTPQTSSPEDSTVMYTIDGRKRNIII